MKWPRNDSRPQYPLSPLHTNRPKPLLLPPTGREKGDEPNPTRGMTSHPGCLAHAGFPPVSISVYPVPSTNHPSSPPLNPSHPPSASPLSAPCDLSFPGSSFTRESPPRHPSIATTPASPTLPIAFSFHPYEASNQHGRR